VEEGEPGNPKCLKGKGELGELGEPGNPEFLKREEPGNPEFLKGEGRENGSAPAAGGRGAARERVRPEEEKVARSGPDPSFHPPSEGAMGIGLYGYH